MKKYLIIGLITAGLTSCAYMFNEVVSPNRCKKCVVVDQFGTEVWSEDECGGGTANMDLRCKAEAYDRGCDYTCQCEVYRTEEEE